MPLAPPFRQPTRAPRVAGFVLVIACLVAVATGMAQGIPRFLAPNDPIGKGAFVVEGWMDADELRRATEVYRRGPYVALVVTGGPMREAERVPGAWTYAERAALELRELGIVEPELVVLPTPATERDRTFHNGLAVRKWLDGLGRPVAGVDVASHGFHARRSRALYEVAIGPGTVVGVVSIRPSEYDPEHWWRSVDGVKDLFIEGAGYARMACSARPVP